MNDEVRTMQSNCSCASRCGVAAMMYLRCKRGAVRMGAMLLMGVLGFALTSGCSSNNSTTTGQSTATAMGRNDNVMNVMTGNTGSSSYAPAAEVHPLIGTGHGPGGSINLFPGPSMPFGMVQLSPDTQSRGFGYHYYQRNIQGFSMTHMSGPGCDNEGDVFFTATTGAVHTQVKNFQSAYSHSHESASPGYYRVKLLRWGINAQLTATDRCGLAKFTFPAGKQANILIPISHTLNFTVASHVHIFHSLWRNKRQQRHFTAVYIPTRIVAVNLMARRDLMNFAVKAQITTVGITENAGH